MHRHDLSRKQFLSLGFVGSLGLLVACTLDDEPIAGAGAGSGTGGGAGSTTSTTSATGGSGGATSSTTSSTSSATGGSGGSASSTGGGAGNGGASSTGGSAGSAGSAGNGGNAGSGGSGGKVGSGGMGGCVCVKDAGAYDAGSCGAAPVAAIAMNHVDAPHYLTIPVKDIVAGVDMVYQTSSAPTGPPQTHSHYVKITAADFAALRAGMTITKKSCDSHEHQYGLRCGTMATVPTGTACSASDFCGAQANPC
jgi:hypothetical protein